MLFVINLGHGTLFIGVCTFSVFFVGVRAGVRYHYTNNNIEPLNYCEDNALEGNRCSTPVAHI